MITVHLHWILEKKCICQLFLEVLTYFRQSRKSGISLTLNIMSRCARLCSLVFLYASPQKSRGISTFRGWKLNSLWCCGSHNFFPLIFFSLPSVGCNNFIVRSVVCTYGNYNIIWDDLCRTSLKIWTIYMGLCEQNTFVSWVLLSRDRIFFYTHSYKLSCNLKL